MFRDPRSSTNFKQKYWKRNCSGNVIIKLMKMFDKEKSLARNKSYDLQRSKHTSQQVFTWNHTNQKIMERYFWCNKTKTTVDLYLYTPKILFKMKGLIPSLRALGVLITWSPVKLMEIICKSNHLNPLEVVLWANRKWRNIYSEKYMKIQLFFVVQSPSRVHLFMSPWTSAGHTLLSLTISRSLPKSMWPHRTAAH